MQQHSGMPCQRRRRRSCPGSGHPSRCSACLSRTEARLKRVGSESACRGTTFACVDATDSRWTLAFFTVAVPTLSYSHCIL
jgi:hypothetical protein